ncbi:MAG: hypothetical protein IME99_00135 [Proteobacteria bacterium]|nr:hypothetical protein [Pseudomonadota bacterium]
MKVRESLLKYISPKVPVEVRRDAARLFSSGSSAQDVQVEGAEKLTTADRLTILFILSFDSDPETSKEAATGFAAFDTGELATALADKLDPRLLRSLISLHSDDAELHTLIADNPGADATVKELVAAKVGAQEAVAGPESKEGPESSEEPEEEEEGSIYKRLQKMNAAEKIKLGLTGGKAERGLLINDANKIVSNAVLKNPRITDGEIIMLVNSKTASDEVLRMIARNREWVKNPQVKIGLITNPKTPLPIAMRFLDYIEKRELAKIAKSKNVSSVLSSNAMRKMERMR